MNLHSLVRAGALFFVLCSAAHAAVDPATVPELKRTKLGLYVTAQEASELRKSANKVLLVDVRTRAEATFVGMAQQADALVPYMEPSEFMNEWDEARQTYQIFPNNNFLEELQRRMQDKGITKSDTIILMCRSGDRSARAADLLAAAGFSKVYSVIDGFEGDLAKDGPKAGQRAVNGWKNSGLPWSYKLDKSKAYLPK